MFQKALRAMVCFREQVVPQALAGRASNLTGGLPNLCRRHMALLRPAAKPPYEPLRQANNRFAKHQRFQT